MGRPKTPETIVNIDRIKRELADENLMKKTASKGKATLVNLKEEYELFLAIEDLKDELEIARDAGDEGEMLKIANRLIGMHKDIAAIQRRHG